jgi:hypothetical protein
MLVSGNKELNRQQCHELKSKTKKELWTWGKKQAASFEKGHADRVDSSYILGGDQHSTGSLCA